QPARRPVGQGDRRRRRDLRRESKSKPQLVATDGGSEVECRQRRWIVLDSPTVAGRSIENRSTDASSRRRDGGVRFSTASPNVNGVAPHPDEISRAFRRSNVHPVHTRSSGENVDRELLFVTIAADDRCPVPNGRRERGRRIGANPQRDRSAP